MLNYCNYVNIRSPFSSNDVRQSHPRYVFTFPATNSAPRSGESHCPSVGCIIDGCPPGLALSEEDIQPQLTRRRPGQSALSTPRDEKDRVYINSGVENGYTLGTPINLSVNNENQRPGDYKGELVDFPRPSHADFTYQEKYGIRASSGGGRSSARETIARGMCTQSLIAGYIACTSFAGHIACSFSTGGLPCSASSRYTELRFPLVKVLRSLSSRRRSYSREVPLSHVWDSDCGLRS